MLNVKEWLDKNAADPTEKKPVQTAGPSYVARTTSLITSPDFIPAVPQEKTIQQQFEEFHVKNPRVYELLVKYARVAKFERGYEKLGVKYLVEIVRWSEHLSTTKDGGFKINDIFTSRYARLIMEKEPDLEGFFEIRQLQRA